MRIPSVLAAYVGGIASDFRSNKWQREDYPIYPMSALREGVLNALVHRDYNLTGSTLISIAPDSLQISNPGGLPPGLTTADLKRDHPSLPRNPDIAHILFLHGLIEKVGRGTQRILEDCRAARLRDPKWQFSEIETKLSCYFSVKSTTFEHFNERQQKIVVLLKKKQQLRVSDLVNTLGGKITERTIRNDLQALVDGSWLVRRGRGRSTSYVEGPSLRLK